MKIFEISRKLNYHVTVLSASLLQQLTTWPNNVSSYFDFSSFKPPCDSFSGYICFNSHNIIFMYISYTYDSVYDAFMQSV